MTGHLHSEAQGTRRRGSGKLIRLQSQANLFEEFPQPLAREGSAGSPSTPSSLVAAGGWRTMLLLRRQPAHLSEVRFSNVGRAQQKFHLLQRRFVSQSNNTKASSKMQRSGGGGTVGLASRPLFLTREILPDAIVFRHPLPENAKARLQRAMEAPAPKETLTQEEIEEIRWLRREDPFGWSQSTLAQRFGVRGEVIGRVAPEPESKERAIRESTAPKIRDIIARRRWTAQERIRRGLEPLTDEEWKRLYVKRTRHSNRIREEKPIPTPPRRRPTQRLEPQK